MCLENEFAVGWSTSTMKPSCCMELEVNLKMQVNFKKKLFLKVFTHRDFFPTARILALSLRYRNGVWSTSSRTIAVYGTGSKT